MKKDNIKSGLLLAIIEILLILILHNVLEITGRDSILNFIIGFAGIEITLGYIINKFNLI